MVCKVCGERKARRACPAVRADICSICCGTKRETEIRCPADCQYLVSARVHPAAVTRRQQEEDLRAFLPSIRDLTERQAELLWPVAACIRDYRGDDLLRTSDADIEMAAAALAATYDTASRGLIYEQRAASLPAQRLAAEIATLVSKLPGDRVSSFDRDLAAVFRAIERGAREVSKALGGENAYQGVLRRLMAPSQRAADQPPASDAPASRPSSLIIP